MSELIKMEGNIRAHKKERAMIELIKIESNVRAHKNGGWQCLSS